MKKLFTILLFITSLFIMSSCNAIDTGTVQISEEPSTENIQSAYNDAETETVSTETTSYEDESCVSDAEEITSAIEEIEPSVSPAEEISEEESIVVKEEKPDVQDQKVETPPEYKEEDPYANDSGRVDDPNSINFDPYHKEGYVYVPGEGYLEIDKNAVAHGEELFNGESFWDILNDPNNKIIGYW